jgi:hypothetical protein
MFDFIPLDMEETAYVCGYFQESGSYYPLGIRGTVPRAYDMFRAYEGMEGRKIKINKLKIGNIIL